MGPEEAGCDDPRDDDPLTGDSKCPSRLEREKSLTSLLSHWLSDCCRRREGDEGGEGGVVDKAGKPDISTAEIPSTTLPPSPLFSVAIPQLSLTRDGVPRRAESRERG